MVAILRAVIKSPSSVGASSQVSPSELERRGLGSASSKLSQGELQSFCRLYQIPASVHPHLPHPGDQVSACSDRVTIFTQSNGGEPNIPLFCRFYRFRVDGDWFTFEKRWPQNFPSCVSRVLQSLHDWKLRFFFVNNNFLPARLPLRDMRNPIVDEAPPLRDCDVPLFRLLVENPTPAIVFPEPVLVMARFSPLWDEPEFWPAVMEEGQEMNLLKILKKANHGMEFVAVESSIPPPPSSHMELLPVSPSGSAEEISSPDDDELPLAALLEKMGRVTRYVSGSVELSSHPPLKFRQRSSGQRTAVSLLEMFAVTTPITDEPEEASSLRRKKGKQVIESDVAVFAYSPIRELYEPNVVISPGGVSVPATSACLEMPVSAVLIEAVSVAVAPMCSSYVVPLILPTPKNVATSSFVHDACYRDLDSFVLAHQFTLSLESHRDLGLEIVRRLQHRSDVAMKFQQRIASVEDELVKALEDKKQLLGELLDVDALRAESKNLRKSLRVANDKVAASERRVAELGSEVDRCVGELWEQRGDIKSYKIDISVLEELMRDLKRLLEGKQACMEEAQADALTTRVEIARLSEENQRLQPEVVEVEGMNQQLAADRAWLVTQGFRRVFNFIRDSQEYVQLLGDVKSICLVVGYQNGLRAGYKYSGQGLFLEESSCYDPTAEAWMTKVTLALGAADHLFLSRLENSPDIPVANVKALTAVVDPTTPRP
ncbi:hypothetical protein E3N88_06823 [Mikania micrantha]|uniref:Uncharacterized protein n=1 Tax=Mikania micrantha TaxID=192012 RepID=A0A5N6PRW5_9ASTR|nr:hypothetical protein E3N88_06823 [Mikania micrantha]